jgi:6-pyruvoyl-tetrahydropterin synthase-like protein
MLFVAIAATAVIAPMLFLGQASGHDFQFHLASWLDVAGQWREGILFPRWAEWANWGFGEPRFIFYPPASWMLGAGLGSILPWKVAPGAFIWLTLIFAGYAMWRFAREYLSPGQAAGAAVLYAVNPYNLVNVYYRSDFAELLAGAIFPLLLWGTLRTMRDGWRSLPRLAVPFAAIWLSNAPAAVLATYSIALVAFVCFIQQRAARPLVVCGTGMATGFGLAAFYIVPAAWEQRWVQIEQILSDLLRPDHNFLFTHSDNPEFVIFNWKVSAVAMGVILASGILAVFVARRRNDFSEVWAVLLALGGAATLMMFPVSILAWRWLPKLQFVQFPWRWLGPLDFVFAFFAAAAFGNAKRKWLCWTTTFVLLFGLATAIVCDAWWDSEDIPVLTAGIRSGHGYEGTDEYQPLGSSRYDLPGVNGDGDSVTGPPVSPLAAASASDPGAALTTGASLSAESWTAESRIFSSSSTAPILVAVRLLNYPAWQVALDGSAISASSEPETGQLLIPVPAGTHRVVIRLGRTLDRKVGACVSGIFLLAMLVFGFATKPDLIASKESRFET